MEFHQRFWAPLRHGGFVRAAQKEQLPLRKIMKLLPQILLLIALFAGGVSTAAQPVKAESPAVLLLPSQSLTAQPDGTRLLGVDGLFYETTNGRTALPAALVSQANGPAPAKVRMVDGREITISVTPEGQNFLLRLSAKPDADIIKWGLAVDAQPDEYFTGLMERVVDGAQQQSWAPGRKEAMNLRGQKVDMIVKATTAVYAPFYLSSRGYAVFIKGTWPGWFDFCADNPQRVLIQFEGPAFEMKIYTSEEPAALVRQHALDAGPPLLPPKWTYTPWRWRDEHTQRPNYYDGTPVTGPFNSEAMEDILMMKAYGIPCGVYWIDRPWGPGHDGYDDFEIDTHRLPNFAETIKWLNTQDTQMMLWLGPFWNGQMAKNALANGYNLPGQPPQNIGQNYPLVDYTNPKAVKDWQNGVGKLLKLGVAGFKLDRSEENIPEHGNFKVFDGRSVRENRNAYPPMYLKAVYDVSQKYRGNDFVAMPRAAYTGSAAYGVFWGGDISGTAEGLRASIVAVQRSAVMGYPNWGADSCGYTHPTIDQEVCARWLGFSCFTPIMEVGPTRNVAFWNLPRNPSYDTELIAVWRLYARLHQRLADYSYRCGQEAHLTGTPIVRPLFMIDPKAPQAWTNWETYLYGPDLLASPIWEKGKRTQAVYLPAGREWRDAWHPDQVYPGGQTIIVNAEPHQIPLFIRVGSDIKLGDLNQEYKESLAIAAKKPDLKALDAEVKAWFETNKQPGTPVRRAAKGANPARARQRVRNRWHI